DGNELLDRLFPLGSLAVHVDPANGAKTYYLASKTAAGPRAGAPCALEGSTLVRPWWDGRPVRVCKHSYAPDHVFDEVGYCGGKIDGDGLLARPGCGCGPLLLACLPPAEELGDLGGLARAAVEGEYFETMLDIVLNDRPLSERVTTSTIWQTGFADFLYAR